MAAKHQENLFNFEHKNTAAYRCTTKDPSLALNNHHLLLVLIRWWKSAITITSQTDSPESILR